MQTATSFTKPTHFFILIGIGYYARGDALLNKDGDIARPKTLPGAVPDVDAFQDYITGHPELAGRSRIHLLRSTPARAGSSAMSPIESARDQPTYENILRVFHKVTTELEEAGGGIVHVHFSCHGLRVKTNYPEVKGYEGVDEAIVPYNARVTGHTLRDVELAILIWRMTEKGGLVSVVCDLCHAGDVTRGDDESDDGQEAEIHTDGQESNGRRDDAVKSSTVTSIPLPDDNIELRKAIKNVWKHDSRGDLPHDQVLQAVKYDLFASCRVDQKSYETMVNGRNHGLFTHTLMTILNKTHDARLKFTHSGIHNQILATLAPDEGQPQKQTPIFSGNGRRHFLQKTQTSESDSSSLCVISGRGNGPLRLSGGRFQGVTKGSTYAVHPWDKSELGDATDTKEHVVEIVAVGPTTSTARWVPGQSNCSSKDLCGWQAVLLKYKLEGFRIRLRKSLENSRHTDMLKSLSDLIRGEETGILMELVDDDSTNGENGSNAYDVGISADNKYQLLDIGGQLISGFPTCGEANVFFWHLKHVSRFDTLLSLSNPLRPSWLDRCLEIYIGERNITDLCSWDGSGLEHASQYIDLEPGEHTLAIRNTTGESLTVTGFNFSPTWKVEIFYPLEEEYALIPGGEEKKTSIPLDPLPAKWDRKIDLVDDIKFLVAGSNLQVQTLRSMQMDPLLDGNSGSSRGSDLDELEQVLSGLPGVDDRGFSRRSVNSVKKNEAWSTIRFRVRTVPSSKLSVGMGGG